MSLSFSRERERKTVASLCKHPTTNIHELILTFSIEQSIILEEPCAILINVVAELRVQLQAHCHMKYAALCLP